MREARVALDVRGGENPVYWNTTSARFQRAPTHCSGFAPCETRSRRFDDEVIRAGAALSPARYHAGVWQIREGLVWRCYRHTAGLLALLLLGLAIRPGAVGADPMTVEVVPRSTSGVFRDATVVYLDGEIDPDAPGRLSRALDRVDGEIRVWLNSPGGNLFAGMQLGRILRQRGGVDRYH